MIYTKLTQKAMQIAYSAHHGQTDCNGMPYVFHPYHLAEQMDDEISCCVALLHDVAEDTEVTLDELAKDVDRSRIVDSSVVAAEKLDKWDEKYGRAMEILTQEGI